MSPFENFQHTHEDHHPGSAVAMHRDTEDDFDAPGFPGRLAHDEASGMLHCDDGHEWTRVHPGPHDHDADHAPGRALTDPEASTLDSYIANAEPAPDDTAAAVKALASVLRRT